MLVALDPFQSHYGAIATWASTDEALSFFSFNPTMVRLRRHRLPWP